MSARPKPDSVTVKAVDLARSALLAEVDAADVGEHLSAVPEGERVTTHYFACTRRGYVGWNWAVIVARAPRMRTATVDEIVLLPGEEAIVAPAWLPYKERLQPGDLSPGDLLPVEEDDERLVPTYLVGEDSDLRREDREQIRSVARELGLGRVRTLSSEGLDQAAERWFDGAGGPSSPLAQAAPDTCWSCGFLVRLAGSLSSAFGVCANGNANDDGKVVSVMHGCGAHSEVRLQRRHRPQKLPDHVYDTLEDEVDSW